MAKHRKRGKTSKQSLPLSFSTDIVSWQDGDTTKPDPLFILVMNNIALERPLRSNHFVADMSTGSTSERKLFTKTAKGIKKNLFGQEPGQAEKLLADSPHSHKIKFWSMYVSGLAVGAASSLVGEHSSDDVLTPRRDAVVSMLAYLGMNPDIVFLVTNSQRANRASSFPATDDDMRGGIATTYDGRKIYHRFYHKYPGMVAIHVDNTTMTPGHEFGHAFSSFTNGHMVDLYSDDSIVAKRKRRWPIPGNFPFNRKSGRPIPNKFANYADRVYLSAQKRFNSFGYEESGLKTSYHPEQPGSTDEPALMDDYNSLTTQPELCLHDKITKAYIMDRIAAKVSR